GREHGPTVWAFLSELPGRSQPTRPARPQRASRTTGRSASLRCGGTSRPDSPTTRTVLPPDGGGERRRQGPTPGDGRAPPSPPETHGFRHGQPPDPTRRDRRESH